MTKLIDLTTTQLQRAIDIKQQIETLQNELDLIEGGETPSKAQIEAPAPAKRQYHMSPTHKRELIKRLAEARAMRSAKIKGTAAKADKPVRKRRKMSAAAKAKISAAAKARWAKARLEGKKTL
jgi:acetoin utilization deacetylase AcuC-like enzyme